MGTLILTGSVGSGREKGRIPHNSSDDVIKVRDRLVDLGYKWVSSVTRGNEPVFIKTIKLIQSIIKGSGKLDKGDGRIDLKGTSHRWLAAINAPGWVEIFGKSGRGWVNSTPNSLKTNGGYCTSWLLEAINAAGTDYALRNIGINNPGYILPIPLLNVSIPSIGLIHPPMWIRECSPEKGGNARGHGSHETGLDVDMRLPLLPPHAQDWTNLHPRGFNDPRFDKVAAKEQLRSIKKTFNAKIVLFNDPEFIRMRLCSQWPNHHQHYHIRIKPPTRIDGVYQ